MGRRVRMIRSKKVGMRMRWYEIIIRVVGGGDMVNWLGWL
jgi:hypothetical protein